MLGGKLLRIVLFLVVVLVMGGFVYGVECGSTPTDGCSVSQNTTFNPGTYYLPSGITIFNTDNKELDCNGAILVGPGGSDAISGIYVLSASYITIRNCVIQDYPTGIQITFGSSNSNVFDSTISGGLYPIGVYQADSVTIIGNTVMSATTGITLLSSDNSRIEQNQIYGHSFTGIEVTSTCANTVVRNNNLYNNDFNILLFEEPTNPDAEYNWWGTTNETEIEEKIFDYYDDSTVGIVDYYPYLCEAYPTSDYAPCESCSCGGWQDQGCGAGGCALDKMYQTRSCTPSGCDDESQCVDDASCTLECTPGTTCCDSTGHYRPYGYDCGTCQACDGAGSCSITPTDDSDCGIISCDDWHHIVGAASPFDANYCYDSPDITSNRCEGLGNCKDANTADCGSADDTLELSCGVCQYVSGCSGTIDGYCSNYAEGTACGAGGECDGSGNCVGNCSNGFMDIGEEGVDCGGKCEFECDYCIPIIRNGNAKNKLDLVFIGDKTYSENWDLLLEHAYINIYDVLNKTFFIGNDMDNFNFYYVKKEAVSSKFCGILPLDFNGKCPHADVSAILHTDEFEDCTRGTVFTSEGENLEDTFIHETGHAAFGLADEYEGFTRYFQPDPHPNIWKTNESCRDDANKSGWDPNHCWQFCDSFLQCDLGYIGNDGWWKIDPSDIMESGSYSYFGSACWRRIDWIFDEIDLGAGFKGGAPFILFEKAIITELNINDGIVTMLNSTIVYGISRNYIDQKLQFNTTIYALNGSTLGSFSMWDPRIALVENGFNTPSWVDNINFTVVLPYIEDSEIIEIKNENDDVLIEVNITEDLDELCSVGDGECDSDCSVGVDPDCVTYISSCTTITEPGIYHLTQDIINSTTEDCMDISANTVTLDCQGHIIDGDRNTDYGISVSRTSPTSTSATIRNCTLTDWTQCGIRLAWVSDNILGDINASSNVKRGICVSLSTDNIIKNSYATNNGEAGFYFYQGSNNELYNSEFSNNGDYDFYVNTYGEDWPCDNTLVNITGTDDKPIVYYNDTVIMKNWNNNVSEIVLCNADYSIIENVTLSHTNKKINGFLIVRSDNLSMVDINVSNSNRGIELVGCSNVMITNSYTHNNLEYGITLNGGSDTIVNNSYSYNNVMGIFDFNIYTVITDSYFYNNTYGIYTGSFTPYHTYNSNRIFNNSYGVHIGSYTNNNMIYNNLFNNTNNVEFSGTIVEGVWNIPLTPGTNIIGGSYFGGNYYTNPTGNGFSDTCDDSAPSNGICDTSYDLSGDGQNVDYLPLTQPYFPIIQFNISLLEGWNLISIPLELNNWTMLESFYSIEGNYSKIFTYMGEEWIELQDNDEINEPLGLWIKMLSDDTLIVEGKEMPGVNIGLINGWNLIGYPLWYTTLINESLDNINYSVVYAYNGTWSSYIPLRGDSLNGLESFIPGYGYWIKSNENSTLQFS